MEKIAINYRGMITQVVLNKDEAAQMQIVKDVLIIDITLYGQWVRQVRFGFE